MSVIKALIVAAVVIAVTVATLGASFVAEIGYFSALQFAALTGKLVAIGFIAGFAGGVTNAILNGASPGQVLVVGMSGAALGGISGALTFGIGHKFGFISEHVITRAIAHGVVSGVMSPVRGGNFRNGFMSTFFSTMAGGIQVGTKWVQGIFQTMVGGTASSIGGGKFANGAVSAAMVYLFNDSASSTYPSRDEMINGRDLKYDTWDPLKMGGDFIDGVVSIPKGLYALGDFLGRYSGLRDLQGSSVIGLYAFEAKAELTATIEAFKNDYTRSIIIDNLKTDITSRPFYYIGGLGLGGVISIAKVPAAVAYSTSIPIGTMKTFGGGMNYVHTEINPFH